MGIERSALYQYVFSLLASTRPDSALELTLAVAVCGSYSHAKCAGYLQGGCSTAGHGQAQDDTLTIISQSPVMFGNDLVRSFSPAPLSLPSSLISFALSTDRSSPS